MTKYRVVGTSISNRVEIALHDSIDKAFAHLAMHITNYIANGNSGHVLTIENAIACLRLSTISDDYFDEDDRFMKREFKIAVYAGLKSNYDFSESCNVELGRWKYSIEKCKV
jgi:hypothetical protein